MYLLKVLTQINVYLLDRTFYYLSHEEVFSGVRVKINFNNNEIVGYVVSSKFKDKSKDEIEKELGINLSFVEEVIDKKPILTSNLLRLALELKKRYIYPLIGVLQTMLPPSLKPKKTFENSAKIQEVEYYFVNKSKINDYNLTKNENKILEKFNNKEIILKKDLNKTKSLESLIDKGIILVKKEEKYRYSLKQIFSNYENTITLTAEQEKAYINMHNYTMNIEKYRMGKQIL